MKHRRYFHSYMNTNRVTNFLLKTQQSMQIYESREYHSINIQQFRILNKLFQTSFNEFFILLRLRDVII